MPKIDESRFCGEANADPSPDELHCWAGRFRDLGRRSLQLGHQPVDNQRRAVNLRWELCFGVGVPAGDLLIECLDGNAFSQFAYTTSHPDWDFRGYDETSTGTNALLAGIALSHEKLPLVVTSAEDQNSSVLERKLDRVVHPESTRPPQEGDDAQDLPLLDKFLREYVIDGDKRNDDTRNTVMLCTFIAAIRWWLSDFDGFRGDVRTMFHPWIEALRRPPFPPSSPKLPSFASDPNVPADEAAIRILTAHAQIQSHACEVLAALLEKEADKYESGKRMTLRQRVSRTQESLAALDALFEDAGALARGADEHMCKKVGADWGQRCGQFDVEHLPWLEHGVMLCEREAKYAALGTESLYEREIAAPLLPLRVRFARCSSAILNWGFARLENRREAEFASYAKRALDEGHEHSKSLLAYLDGIASEKGDALASVGGVEKPKRWQPSSGYVGTIEITYDSAFSKKGKNPPQSTIQRWVERDARLAASEKRKAMKIETAPDTHENYYPKKWVLAQISLWNPRPQTA